MKIKDHITPEGVKKLVTAIHKNNDATMEEIEMGHLMAITLLSISTQQSAKMITEMAIYASQLLEENQTLRNRVAYLEKEFVV